MRNISIIFTCLILFISCRKERSYNVIGKYECEVTAKWVMSMPTYSSGTEIFYETIDIKKKCCKKGEIEVLDDVIIIDASKHYHGDHQSATYDTFDIQFTNDSVHISYYSGGRAGGTGYDYKGRKID